MYAVYHGPEGVRRIAERVHRVTRILAAGLKTLGVEVVHGAYFDTLTVSVPGVGDREATVVPKPFIDPRKEIPKS